VLVLVVAGVSFRYDLGARWFGWDYPSPVEEPAEVAPPPGLELPEPVPAAAVAEDSPTSEADPAAVRRAVADLVADPDLGPRAAVAVRQLADGETVYSSGPAAVIPASTMKIATAVAALAALGPDHRFRTTVVAPETPSAGGTQPIVLVGGGDPLLARSPGNPTEVYPARADLQTLAEATVRALERSGRERVRLGYDVSLFEGPAASPDWRPTYTRGDVVSPIVPLWVDAGRERTGLTDRFEDPASVAAAVFADALRERGITVVGRPRQTTAAVATQELAGVESAPLAQVVQRMLEVSDNETAEVLFRHVAIATGHPGSFAGGSAAVRAVLDGLGVDTAGAWFLDGSGLARDNRLGADTLLDLLQVAASEEHPDLRTAVTGLPVAGFTGSLTYRFDTVDPDDAVGLGRVRAKTGTLSGVHGLAGVVTDRDGTVLSFVAVADRVRLSDTFDARATLDEIAAALAACHCARRV